MIESAAVKDQIREYVLEEFAKSKGINQISDTEALTKNGIIDSMGIFRLVAFIEETFNVRVGDEEITNENLESVEAIERLVLSKVKK
jgi:acyl carrier protein